MSDTIDHYIEQIDKLLPYPSSKKEDVLEELRFDVEETMRNSEKKNPSIIFGAPRDVAKSLCLSQDWIYEYVGWIRRTLAFIIDSVIQFAVFLCLFFSFWTGFRSILSLFMSGEEIGQIFRVTIPREFSLTLGFTVLNSNPTFFFTFTVFVLFTSIIVFLFYSVALEHLFSTTIGKKTFGMKVVDESGIRITWKQALIRNFTKSYFFLEILIFDIILGMVLERQEPKKGRKQRGLDILAKTLVIK
jgi:uncharacterized RDD family membrane protein YckC